MSKKLKIAAVSGALIAGGLTTVGIINATAINNGLAVNNTTTINNSIPANNKLVDETIYVFTKTDGSVRKMISSDWTKNLDIDTFSKSEVSDKSAPIDLKITYFLDDKAIAAKDLAGKSGKVKIRYEFENTQKSGGYYIPYVIATGVILDNNNFKNVEVINGKLLQDGSRNVVVGFALPGMQENLGIAKTTFEIPDYFEITADATDFSLGMTMSIATNEIFSELDTSSLNSLSDIESQLNKLTDAMDQLIGGSSDLYSGLEELYTQASKLPEGVAALKVGSAQLKSGAAQLNNAVDDLYSGIDENFISKNAELQAGTDEIVTTILTSARSQIVDALSEKLVPALVSKGYTKEQASAKVASLVPELTISGYSSEIDSIMTNVATFINSLPISDAEKQAYINALSDASAQLASAKDQLEKVAKFYQGVYAYTNGLAYLNEVKIKGLATDNETSLKEAASALAAGATSLDDGLETLNTSAPQLLNGVEQLRDGSAKLKDGIKQFNDEGIAKITNYYQNDVKSLINRLNTIANLAKANAKNTKYIYRVDEIK